MELTTTKCDCDEWIAKQIKENNESINNYNSMIADCEEMTKELNQLRSENVLW
jgi:predicted nuclease with TOPRIM domain